MLGKLRHLVLTSSFVYLRYESVQPSRCQCPAAAFPDHPSPTCQLERRILSPTPKVPPTGPRANPRTDQPSLQGTLVPTRDPLQELAADQEANHQVVTVPTCLLTALVYTLNGLFVKRLLID